MKKLLYRIFCLFMAAHLVIFLTAYEVHATMTIPNTVGQFLSLTSSGGAKVGAAAAGVGAATVLARVFPYAAIALTGAQVAIWVYDALNPSKRDGATANVSLPVTPATTSFPANKKYSWGVATGTYDEVRSSQKWYRYPYKGTTCPDPVVVTYANNANATNPGLIRVGGSVEITGACVDCPTDRGFDYSYCDAANGFPTINANTIVKNYYVSVPVASFGNSSVGIVGQQVSSQTVTDTQTLYNGITQTLAQLQSDISSFSNIVSTMAQPSVPSTDVVQLLTDIKGTLENGVSLSPGDFRNIVSNNTTTTTTTTTNPDGSVTQNQASYTTQDPDLNTPVSQQNQNAYDSSYTNPDKKDIVSMVTGYISQNPLVSVITGTRVTVSGGVCSLTGSVLGHDMILNFCPMQGSLDSLGNIIFSVSTLTGILIVFRRD